MRRKLIHFIIIPIILLVVVFQLAIYIINVSLPEVLKENLGETFIVEFENIDFSAWKKSISIQSLSVSTNENQTKLKSTLNASIEEIEIRGVHIKKLLFDKEIETSKVLILNPNIEITSNEIKERTVNNSKTLNEFWRDFFHSIEMDVLELKNGYVHSKNSINKELRFTCENINFNVKGVSIDSLKFTNPLPFEYDNFHINVGALYSNLGDLYSISLDSFAFSNSTLLMDRLEVKPLMDKKEFEAHIKVEQDYIDAVIDSIRMDNSDWGFHNDSLYIQAENLEISQADISFYRNKELPDNLSHKNLYGSMLRNLPFLLNIDSLHLRNSQIQIEEHRENKSETGYFVFSDISITGTHLSNFEYKTDSKPVNLNFRGELFGDAAIYGNLNFMVKSKNDAYRLHGNLKHFDISKMNAFTMPNMNVSLTGELNEIDFIIYGNENDAKAYIETSYSDLKFVLLNENQKKRRLINAAGNLIVKGNIENEKVEVEVPRIKEKSVYNQIIKCIIQGLKKEAL